VAATILIVLIGRPPRILVLFDDMLAASLPFAGRACQSSAALVQQPVQRRRQVSWAAETIVGSERRRAKAFSSLTEIEMR